MSDLNFVEKKSEEIKNDFKLEEINQQQEDQKNRLDMMNQPNGNVIINEAAEDWMILVNAQERQNLNEVREDFEEKMPEEAKAVENAEVIKVDRAKLPETMQSALDEILRWRKTKAETSVPVKEAAKALKDAKNDDDAAAAMADLAVACSRYMDINGGNFFKSSRRKEVVTNLLNDMADFIAKADMRYYENYELSADKLVSKTADSFVGRMSLSAVAAENTESFEDAIQKKRERALERHDFEKREYNRLNGISDLDEEEKKELVFVTAEERRQEFEQIKATKPGFTEEDYRVFESARESERYMQCPAYLDAYKKAKDVFKDHVTVSMERDMGLLKQVYFDKNWKPISKQDKENHEWNLKFFDALDKDDFRTTEDMIAESYPHMFDAVELPNSITAAELKEYKYEFDEDKKAEMKNKLKVKFNEWLEDLIKHGDIAKLNEMNKKMLAIDNLALERVTINMYKDANPLFMHKSNFQRDLGSYLAQFMPQKFGFTMGKEVKIENKVFEDEKSKQNYEKSQNDAMDERFERMLETMFFINEHKNDAEDPYYKKTISDEEYYKRLEDRKLEKAKKERDAVRDAIQKENEKKRQEKEQAKADLKQEKAIIEELKKENEKQNEKQSEKQNEKQEEKQEVKQEVKPAKKTKMKAASSATKKARKAATKKIRAEVKEQEADLVKNAALYASRQTQAQKEITKDNITIDKTLLSTKEKQRNAKRLEQSVDSVTDAKVALRNSVSLDVKKKTDYLSFSRLSDFAYLTGGKETLEKLVLTYAESKKNVADIKKNKSADAISGKEAGYPVLDMMTAQLLTIDASVYDVRSDEAICKNAVALEKLARAIETYKKMVDDLGGSDYFDHLSKKKTEGFEGDMGKLAIAQLEKLNAIANYYRVRKLIMENEDYTDLDKTEISTEENEKDTFETKRLKKLKEMSDEYAIRLESAFEEDNEYENGIFDMLNLDEAELHKIEQERFFVAPKWMYNALSLTQLKDRNTDPKAGYAGTFGRAGDEEFTLGRFYRENKKEAHHKAYKDFRKSLLKTAEGSARFVGGKDEYLGKLEICDNLFRVNSTLPNVLSYRRTASEMKEMLDFLAIQKTAKWEEIEKDPEAVAYYESAYKEMSMRMIESIYATVKRVANTVGLKIMVMHPIDLSLQMTTQLKVVLQGVATAASIDQEQNKEMLEKLFKENNTDGRYIFDTDDFREMAGFTDNALWKSSNVGQSFRFIVNGDSFWPEDEELESEMTAGDITKLFFGKTSMMDEADKLKADRIKELEEKPDTDEEAKEELKLLKGVDAPYYWVMKHPEVICQDNYLKKTKEGQFIFGKHVREVGRAFYTGDNPLFIKKTLEKNKLVPLDEDELKAYEKSLNDRNMPKYLLEEDPYGIDLYRNKMEGLVERDEKGNPIMENGEISLTEFSNLPALDPITGKYKGKKKKKKKKKI